MRNKLTLFTTLAALGLSAQAQAAVKPHGMFTDGAVLQRGQKVPIWGTAANGEKVTVRFKGQKVSTVAEGGKWMVWLKPLSPGGPYNLTIQGENKVELKNILVGDVWIASGQSNMEWPLRAAAGGDQAIANSTDAKLRLYQVNKATADSPVREINYSWQECGPESVPNFSAVAYFFGRDLRRDLKVPIGLIHTSWGGTVAEAWTRREVLENNPDLNILVRNYRIARLNYPLAMINYRAALEAHAKAVDQAKFEGKQPPAPPQAPNDPTSPNNPNRPAVLYNAMIAPIIPYGIKGAIWYQGESNAGRAYQYQTLFPEMIRNWRQDWGQGEFPFLFVQLAPFQLIQTEPQESAWAELREAQRLTTLRLPNAGQAVITDAGEERDIHPKDKETVGKRLALAARMIAYRQDVEGSGPTYESMDVEGGKAVLSFGHAEKGLMVKGEKLLGFTIAGEDGKWYNAAAELRGDKKVVVSSPQVKRPVAVRYGWANFPVVNLYNKEGIPASPFRTDDFPLITKPR